MLLAFLLVKPMNGRGIALALSAASLVNTIFLFIFLKYIHTIRIGALLKPFFSYTLKIVLFSGIASVPIYFARPYIVSFFAGHNKLISDGMPVLLTAVLFAASGVLLLVITHDKIAVSALRKISGKIKHTDKTIRGK